MIKALQVISHVNSNDLAKQTTQFLISVEFGKNTLLGKIIFCVLTSTDKTEELLTKRSNFNFRYRRKKLY